MSRVMSRLLNPDTSDEVVLAEGEPTMTAALELIALLATIGQRDDGLGVVARAHVLRLERPKQSLSLRAREERQAQLDGFVELALELELLDYSTASRLSSLAAAARIEVIDDCW